MSDAPSGGSESRSWQRIDTFLLVGLLFWTVAVVSLHNRIYPNLSPIDEIMHVDHAIKSSQFEVVNRNEQIGQETLRDAACRGMDAGGYQPPPCGLKQYRPFEFPEHGVNTSASSWPVYYFLSGVVGRAIQALTPIGSLVAAIRLTGALWMTAGFAACWALAAELGISRRQRAPAFGLILATPQFLFAFSTVTPDNTILFTAAAFTLLVLRYERAAAPAWSVIAAALAVFIVERTNVLVILAAAGFLVFRLLQTRRLDMRAALGPALVLGVIPLWFYLPELHVRLFPAGPPLDFELPRTPFYAADDGYFTFDLILERLGAFVTPIDRAYITPGLRGRITVVLLQFTVWIVIGCVGAVAMTAPARSRVSALTVAAVGCLLAAGPLITYHWSDATYPIQNRFGLPLMPILMVAMAWTLQKPSARFAVGGLAVYSNAYMLFRLLG